MYRTTSANCKLTNQLVMSPVKWTQLLVPFTILTSYFRGSSSFELDADGVYNTREHSETHDLALGSVLDNTHQLVNQVLGTSEAIMGRPQHQDPSNNWHVALSDDWDASSLFALMVNFFN